MTDEAAEVIANIKQFGCWYLRRTKKGKRRFFYGAIGDTSRPVRSVWLERKCGRTPLLECGAGASLEKGTVTCTGYDPSAKRRKAIKYQKPQMAKRADLKQRRCLRGRCEKMITPTHDGEWYCSECSKLRDAVGYTKTSHRIQGAR